MSKQAQCALVALGACLLGSTIVSIVTLAEWLNPTTPALIMLGAAFLPAVLGGLLVMSPPDQHPWTRKLVITGTLPGAIFGLLAVAAGLTWTQPQVRASAASKLPPTFQDATPLLRALNDPFDQVATAACISLANTDFKNHYRDVNSILTSRPTVALSCLQNAEPANDTILTDLAHAWHQNLIHEPLTTSDACELSQSIAKIQNNPSTHTAQILHCSLQAQTSEARQCCTQTLIQAYPGPLELAKILRTSHQLLADLTLGPDLINASFYDKQQLGTMSLKNQDFQRIALLTNCAALKTNAQASSTAFIKLTQSLNYTSQDQTTPDQPDAWTRICENLTRQFTAKPDLAPNLALSAAIDDERQFVAMLQAEQKNMLEQPTEDLSALTEMIDTGSAQIAAQDPHEYLREITGESFEDGHYSIEDIERLRDISKSMASHADDDDGPPGEISAEALKMLEKFPEHVETLKAAGMPKAQIDALEKMNDILKDPQTAKMLQKK